MFSLPPETKLDVFKFLNFEELFLIKQTNRYFNYFINEYEEELACQTFDYIYINDIEHLNRCKSDIFRFIKPQKVDFQLTEQLKVKWQTAIEKSIPMFLHNYESTKNFIVCMEKKNSDYQVCCYHLELPNFPKCLEEMKLVNYILEQLFKCFFKYSEFDKIINPEMIKLIFDNKTTINFQLNIQQCTIWFFNSQKIFEFILDHLNVKEFISIRFNDVENTEEYLDILFNILINEGNKFPHVCYSHIKLPRIYDLIIKHIETSTDLSKMVDNIRFSHIKCPRPEISERAENIKRERAKSSFNRFVKYKLSNINNPKEIFYFNIVEDYGTITTISHVQI
ncbi:hypothetical protein ACQ4LE_005822 [Meloidogyne hapla]